MSFWYKLRGNKWKKIDILWHFGRYIKEAREEIGLTTNDLAFEMVKDKENTNLIKNMEKQIKSWEKEKSYPTLEDIYQIAYIIKINPGELLTLRNRGRKQFYRESDDPPIKRRNWIEISDDASIIFSVVTKFFVFFVLVIFSVVFYKFVDTFFGKTGSIVEQEVIVRQIQKNTDPDNMVNDGTVKNMIHRLEKDGEIQR